MHMICLAVFLACSSAVVFAQSGAVPEALLEGVEKRYAHELLPKPLRPPMTIEQADAFVAGIKYFRDAARQGLRCMRFSVNFSA